jgi:hypothetical protein
LSGNRGSLRIVISDNLKLVVIGVMAITRIFYQYVSFFVFVFLNFGVPAMCIFTVGSRFRLTFATRGIINRAVPCYDDLVQENK